MRFSLIAGLCLAPSLALAQTATQPDLFGPASPQMKGPPTTYQSVFGKQPSGSQPEDSPWRAANEEAGRLGGHVGQLRESEEPAAVPPGHNMHGAAKAAPSPWNQSHDQK